jgi:hypothetical protein
MDKAALPFLLIVGCYIGLEVYGVYSQRHLMEPTNLYAKYVAAQRAGERCGTYDEATTAQFARNVAAMRRMARGKLAAAQPGATPESLAQQLDANVTAARQDVDALIEAQGCAGAEARTLTTTFEQWSTLSLH